MGRLTSRFLFADFVLRVGMTSFNEAVELNDLP